MSKFYNNKFLFYFIHSFLSSFFLYHNKILREVKYVDLK